MLLDILVQETFEETDVETHFRDPLKLRKERLETQSVFQELASSQKVQLVNLACGNFIDVKRFSEYFPHPDSQVFGVDRELFQLALSYHRYHYMSLHQFDLYKETSDLQSFLESKTHWMAIHPCRDLAFQIVRLWNRWGAVGSCLLLVPCCHAPKKQLVSQVGYATWKDIRDEAKRLINNGQNHKVDYMEHALIRTRNLLLQKESSWYKKSVELSCPSMHRTALFYVK